MNFTEQRNLHERLLHFISIRGTGSPDELAKRLGISRPTLYRHLDTLKGEGHPISYNRHRQSFELAEKIPEKKS